MKRCVFFGHRDCPITIKPMLQGAIMELIENGYDDFMVGNNGGFDRMVRHCLEELSHTFGGFRYSIVLERLPKEGEEKIENSILADGIEDCPPRFCIDRRNEYSRGESNTHRPKGAHIGAFRSCSHCKAPALLLQSQPKITQYPRLLGARQF